MNNDLIFLTLILILNGGVLLLLLKNDKDK